MLEEFDFGSLVKDPFVIISGNGDPDGIVANIIGDNRNVVTVDKYEPELLDHIQGKMFLVIKDCTKEQLRKCEKLRNIMLRNRHLNITLVIVTDSVLNLHPALRMNIDYFFMFDEESLQKQVLYERLIDQTKYSFDTLCGYIDEYMVGRCLVYNNRIGILFWYEDCLVKSALRN